MKKEKIICFLRQRFIKQKGRERNKNYLDGSLNSFSQMGSKLYP